MSEKPSTIVQESINALIERERAGRIEHGGDLDRQDLPVMRWLEELRCESLDSANYATKLMHLLPKLLSAVAVLERLGGKWEGGEWLIDASPKGDERDQLGDLVEGMAVSIDVDGVFNTDGRRLFGTVTSVQHEDGEKGGLILLVQDPDPNWTDSPKGGSEAAALRAAPEWQPIETAPEGRLVVVGWLDTEDSHYPENYEFDYLEDGIWAKHEDCVEHANAVAPPGSKMPKEHPPYQWWMDLPAFPAARPQGVKDV